MSSTAHVFVTVEKKNEPVKIKHWTGTSCSSIKKAARKKYEKPARLSFGRCWYSNSYGAH